MRARLTHEKFHDRLSPAPAGSHLPEKQQATPRLVAKVGGSGDVDDDGLSDVTDVVPGALATRQAVLPVAMDARFTDEQVRAWVTRSCAAQGVPVHVTDALVVERVRVLLTGTAVPSRRPAGSSSTAQASAAGSMTAQAATAGSEPPDRLHPVGVQAAGAEDAGADDGVVQDGADDRGLPGQVQLGPLSA